MTRSATIPSQLPKPEKLRIAMVFYVTVLLEGVMLASLGPTLDDLADNSGSTTEAIAILFTANSLGYITGALLAARLYTRLRGTMILAGALAATAVLTFTIPWLGELWLLIAVFGLIGLAVGLIDVGGNTLIVWLYRKDVPPYMNALHLAFGIGAFACPLIVDRFAGGDGDATRAFWLFATLMIPVVVWLMRTPSPDSPAETAQPEAGSAIVRRYALFLALMGLLYFIHMGGELAFAGWIFNYGEETGLTSESAARVLNSMFWAGLVVGRVIAIPLSLRLSPRRMIQLDLVVALGAIGLIGVLPDSEVALWTGTIIFGLAIASIFASCVNFASERIPIASHVMAIFFIGGSLGAMSLPWLIGQYFDTAGPGTMLWVVGVAMAAGIVLFAWIQLHVRRHMEVRAQ